MPSSQACNTYAPSNTQATVRDPKSLKFIIRLQKGHPSDINLEHFSFLYGTFPSPSFLVSKVAHTGATTLVNAQGSVGRKRRSCSGSRNGTPAVKTPSNPVMDIDAAQESESDEGILPCAPLETSGTVSANISEGLNEEVVVAPAMEPMVDGLPCSPLFNPSTASVAAEREPQTEDVQEGPAAEPQGPTPVELTAQEAKNSSGLSLAAVTAPGCKETQEGLSAEAGGPTIEGLPEGEALFASINMSEDEFVRSILLSQPADADAAQVEESLEVQGMGPAVEMQGGVGDALVPSAALGDQPAPEDVPVEELEGVAILGTNADVEGLTQSPRTVSRPGPGLQAPACTPATAAGEEPHLPQLFHTPTIT